MTAELLARCREALKASDEMALPAVRGPWLTTPDYAESNHSIYHQCEDGGTFGVAARVPVANAAHIAANDPATRLALNAALRTVLDAIEATLAEHGYGARDDDCTTCCWEWPCPDHRRALASLAAIATALAVQEEGR